MRERERNCKEREEEGKRGKRKEERREKRRPLATINFKKAFESYVTFFFSHYFHCQRLKHWHSGNVSAVSFAGDQPPLPPIWDTPIS